MKKILIFICLISNCIEVNAQFKGGFGDGFAGSPTYSQSFINIYAGGQSDGFSTALFNQVGAPLPIKLISFTGKKIGETNQLNWQTSSEINASHFDIERSSPLAPSGGISNEKFEKIGQLNMNESKKYEFQDSNPLRGHGGFYRLKLVDLDGKFDYSKIISIDNDIENQIVGQFYPNPTVDNFATIDILATEKVVWTISQYDLTGQLIKIDKKILEKGINKIIIRKLHKGINLFKFQSGMNSFIRKFIN